MSCNQFRCVLVSLRGCGLLTATSQRVSNGIPPRTIERANEMIPRLDDRGYLPPGLHPATLDEIEARFGKQTA